MTNHIPVHTTISATFNPKLPTHCIPPPVVIPWMGSRLTWVAFREPNFGNPDAVSFVLVAGSDGFGLMEEKPLYGPQIIAMRFDLEKVVVLKEGGKS